MRTVKTWSVLLITVLVIWHCPGPLRAQNVDTYQYLDGTSEIWAAPDDSDRPIGKMLVATPVKLISQDGDWIEISMSGWTQTGAERVIYAVPGIRVLRAALAKSAVDRLAFSDIKYDPETDLTWTQTTVNGWLKTPALQPSLQDIWQRAEPLFGERCTACHQRRIPHHYTANQWVSYLKIMGPRTGLPKEDQFLIRAYLQHHAKDSTSLSAPKG